MDKAIPFESIPWWASSDRRLPEYVANTIGFTRCPDTGLPVLVFHLIRPDLIDELDL
jgi:hypothetical protein